jgi:hypothetical protein
MTSAAFRDLAKSSLEPDDAAWLDCCLLSPFGSGPAGSGEQGSHSPLPDFFLRWHEWEQALRLNLARWRAARLKRDISFDAPEYPADAVAAAKAAAAIESPLEAELFLDDVRWKAVETFQGYDYFERNTIYAYLLKLLLLERRSCFRAEEGFAEYKGLYAQIKAASGFDGAEFTQSGEPK